MSCLILELGARPGKIRRWYHFLFGDARLRPLFECGDKCLLREVFGEADVAGEARESGEDARGLNAPDGLDGAMQGMMRGVMWTGSGHCHRSHQLPSILIGWR